MRNLGRILSLGVIWVAGCQSWTFDLLPKKDAPTEASAGSDQTASGGSGGAGAMAGSAGRGAAFGGRVGFGGGDQGGTGGFGAGNQAGMGNGSQCPPGGCGLPHCNRPGCVPCWTDNDCSMYPNHQRCSLVGGCVECRALPNECPYSRTACAADCGDGEVCDSWTDTCLIDCSDPAKTCPANRSVCDDGRDGRGNVCLECDEKHPTCPSDRFCFNGDCVQCVTNDSCSDTAPICNPDTRLCEPCSNDGQCAYLIGNHDCVDGRCVPANGPPPPQP
jgi:hypothetical protein